MSGKRMTANPVKPARYRPGKAVAEEPSSSSDEEKEDDHDEQEVNEQTKRKTAAPPPKTSSFPSTAANISGNLQKVDLNERRRQAAADEAARVEADKAARAAAEEGFVTEESDEEDDESDDVGSSKSGESGSEESDSSSEDEAPKKLLRPTFIKKDQRKENLNPAQTLREDQQWAEEEARRKEKADAMIQEQLEKDAAAKAAGRKDWDDDEIAEVDGVDDTDGLDPETERAEWKLRELKRVKRDREAIETAEKEREEIERRRNLSKEEREVEDREFLEQQKAEREGRGQMGHMQKYVHKGAFFQDDSTATSDSRRDLMASRTQDDTNKELLPEYMQIRDMTKLGRKGRTKYKDLKSEDTGRWGEFGRKGGRGGDDRVDDVFRPDRDGGGGGPSASGSNAAPVGVRRPAPDRAPEGAPRGPRSVGVDSRGGRDTYVPDKEEGFGDGRRRRSYSRSRSPPDRRRKERRRGSYSDSRSPRPRRDRYADEERGSRKRDPSPYDEDRHAPDKRRRVDGS